MFPNPQGALPLPARPNLEQYRKLAKSLLKAYKSQSADPDAIDDWAERWVNRLVKASSLKIENSMPVRVSRWAGEVADFVERHMSSPTKAAGTDPAKATAGSKARA